ncbi:hypothetical protein DSCW_17930 [Desulfosarcina widdelii]|uniref:Uncharacterized protein n=1 Tax=Desulfosarcina widdelii TaxID=947919 RepID=A0A5K7YYB4_9BACT|nr:hypothetical protein [Desulfosarcina widdelii]BBO74376.1 hypothetical protein DSCW_17930 [Desulfosarcina widdelii]
MEEEMYPGFELHFEMTMRSFLGNKADHIAGQAYSPQVRKKWYRKALLKAQKQIMSIDTSTSHREQLNTWCEAALKVLGERKLDEYKLLIYLFRLISALLGFRGLKGVTLYSAFFWQNKGQYYTEQLNSVADPMIDYYDIENSVSIRKELVKELKERGLSDFKIAQVLNTTEYQVKKMKNNL